MPQSRFAPILRSLLILALSLCASAVHAQKIVRQIEIHSGWGGLATPQNADVLIQRKNGAFVCNGKPVDATKVQALVTALEAPSIPQPEMNNLGLTPEWLKANTQLAEQKLPGRLSDATADQKQLFESSFTSPEVIKKVVAALFGYVSMDDYPFAKIAITFEDGSKLTADSDSYYAFMIPWQLSDKSMPSYNVNISRALSVLMPPKAPNKQRLAGEEFISALADRLSDQIKDEWNLLGVESRAGDALSKLRSVYTVERADINPYHNVDYGKAWSEKGPHETNLNVTIRKPSFPPNVSEDVVLLYDQNRVEGVDEFLRTGAKYEDLALSVPWLNDYIREHPKEAVWLAYVHHSSFSDHAMLSFTLDMKARGREDLIPVVRAQQNQIALLKIGFVYWIVFPDKHMMLWRYDGPSGFLKWNRSNFPAGLCGSYQGNDVGCSGREIMPDGTLASEHASRDQECMGAHQAAGVRTADELFPVMDHDRAGFIDITGKLIIPLCFDKLGGFSEGLARFERDDKWGYIDANGSVIIEPKFPWAEEFSEGRARVQVTGDSLAYNGRWGFIDKSGNVVVPPSYRESSAGGSNIGSDANDDAFHEGRAVVKAEDSEGYVDEAGSVVIPLQFTYADRFSEGLAAVAIESADETNSWGYIDTAGKWVIPQMFYRASRFSEHLAFVSTVRDCGYIDPSGKFALQPPIPLDEKDCSSIGGDFSEGLATWRVGKKYGFIDRSGRIAVRPQFDAALHFSEGLAAVRIGAKWGYIDKTGKLVIELTALDSVEDFHHGLAFVRTEDSRYGYINKSGKYVWTPTFLYNN